MGAPPADVTAILAVDPLYPEHGEISAASPSTVTVTSKIKATISTTATATVVVSYCPTAAVSNTVQSVPSARVSITSSAEVPTYSSLPAVYPGYDIPFFNGSSQDGVHMAETSTSTVSSLAVANASRYSTPIHGELPGSRAGFSQGTVPISVILSSNMNSASRMNASGSRSLATDVAIKQSGGLLPMNKSYPITTAWPTGPARIAPRSRFDLRKNAFEECYDAQCETDHTISASGPPLDTTYHASLTSTRKLS